MNQYHVFTNEFTEEDENPIFSANTENEAISFVKKDKKYNSLKIVKGEIVENDEGSWCWKQ